MECPINNLLRMHTIHSSGDCHLKLSPAYTHSHLAPANTEIKIIFPEIKKKIQGESSDRQNLWDINLCFCLSMVDRLIFLKPNRQDISIPCVSEGVSWKIRRSIPQKKRSDSFLWMSELLRGLYQVGGLSRGLWREYGPGSLEMSTAQQDPYVFHFVTHRMWQFSPAPRLWLWGHLYYTESLLLQEPPYWSCCLLQVLAEYNSHGLIFWNKHTHNKSSSLFPLWLHSPLPTKLLKWTEN